MDQPGFRKWDISQSIISENTRSIEVEQNNYHKHRNIEHPD